MRSSSLLRLALRLRSALPQKQLPSTESSPVAISRMAYCTRSAPRQTLQSMLFPLGDPSVSLEPELDRWVKKGNKVRYVELQNIVRDLRRRRRYKQALEVSEWMKKKGNVTFMESDHAVQLDLIGQVRGVESAERYFESLRAKDKNEKAHGALLNCYVRERLIEKSLSHMNMMKEMGLASSALPYNDIMCLFTNTDQHEKVPLVLDEMKDNGVLPDNFSYRICINSYGTMSDITSMEMILEEMEQQPQIVIDWNTYSVVANMYIKAGLTEKAISALRKAEAKLEIRDSAGYDHLISLYGHLGSKTEMWRLWEVQKANCKRFINRDYTTMLGALVKFGELEEAEALMKEWESSGNALDWRVVNVLLAGYRQKGLLEKAEAMLDDFVKKGKTPGASSWGIVAVGFAEKDEMEKAHELMKNALCMYIPKGGWKPNPQVIKSILHYLGDVVELKDVEIFVALLKVAMPVDRDMYHALMKANVRAGKQVDEVLNRMKADGIQENEETKGILESAVQVASLDA